MQALLPFLDGFLLLGPHVLCNIQDNWIQKQTLQFWQELVASTENMKNRLDQMEQSEPVTFVFCNSSLKFDFPKVSRHRSIKPKKQSTGPVILLPKFAG